MTVQTISSGQTSSGLTLSAGDSLAVLSGGVAISAFIGSGAFVSIGGIERLDTVFGHENVGNGGSAIGTTIGSGGQQQIRDGSVALDVTVESGGLQVLTGGIGDPVATGTQVFAGGMELVGLLATASSTTVLGGRVSIAGGTAIDMVVRSGGAVQVTQFYGLGTTSGTFLMSGTETLSGGATAVGTVIGSGGVEILLSRGFASGTEVQSGGTLIVLPGGSATNTTVDAGGSVLSTGAILLSGPTLVSAAGSLSGVTVGAGETEYLVSGMASNTLVTGTGSQIIDAGGQAFADSVESGGRVVISNGGAASFTAIRNGGSLIVDGGTASTFSVFSGGSAQVAGFGASAIATDVLVASGGYLGAYGNVSGVTISGGFGTFEAQVIHALVEAGGELDIGQGSLNGARVQDGGLLRVTDFATATNVTLATAGDLITSNATLHDLTVGSGTYALLGAGTSAVDIDVQAGGAVIVLSGGSVSSATVAAGGSIVSTGVVILSAGAALVVGVASVSDLRIGTATSAYALSGGSVISLAIDGGTLAVYDGGVASDTMLLAPGPSLAPPYFPDSGTETVLSGGLDISATIADGATLSIQSGGTAIGAMIADSGTLRGEGVTSDVVIENGGAQADAGSSFFATVLSGGNLDTTSASFATVMSGGRLGAQFATGTVLSGGAEYADVFGTVDSTTIKAGGILYLASATARNDIISSGGVESIGHAGYAIGTVISDGGVQEVLPYQGGGFHNEPGFASGTVVLSGGEQIAPIPELMIGVTISDTYLSPGGTVDIAGRAYVAGEDAAFNDNTDILTVGGNSGLRIQFAGDYVGEYFHLADDGAGGTAITVDGTPPCYCRGTLILTDGGEVAVEDLRIDDRLVTQGGALRPLRWIGRRSYDGRFAAGNRDVLPVVFHAGSLGADLPSRDLWVSPLHAMYLDGVLVPAACLVNGVGIVQAQSVEQVEYFHLELDTHDVILAEGAPAESYVDDDSRNMFHNAAEHAALYPDATRIPARYCAPRVEHGAALEAIRRRLSPPAAQPEDSVLRGNLDRADRDEVQGWAFDAGVVVVEVLDNGVVLGEAVANRYRADVAAAGIGDGRHGFAFAFPGGLSPTLRHVIEARRAADGAPLPGGTRTLLPADSFDASLERTLSRAIDALSDTAERTRVLGFLLDQADRLRQHQADRDGQRHARAGRHEAARAGRMTAAMPTRVLAIDAATPKAATLDQLHLLIAAGHDVSYVAADTLQAIDLPGVTCCAAPFYGSVEDVLRRQAGCFDLVWCATPTLARRYAPLLAQWLPRARILVATLQEQATG